MSGPLMPKNGEQTKKAEPSQPSPDKDLVGAPGKVLLGAYFLVTAIAFAVLLVIVWPPGFGGPMRPDFWNLEIHLFAVVIVAGGLGSTIHAATSFADFTGNRRLKKSWIGWFLLRQPIGIMLALVVYLVLRGGLLQPQGNETGINPYGIAALAALAGMFSRQATDKLSEVFDTIFRVAPGRSLRADPLASSKPQINRSDPPALTAGTGAQEVRLFGTNFQEECIVSVGGERRRVRRISDRELVLTLLPEDVATAGRPVRIRVINPAPTENESDVFDVTVTAAPGPQPGPDTSTV